MTIATQSFSVLAPDIAAAIQLGSRLSQADSDVTIEPQAGSCYRVFGTTEAAPQTLRSLVAAWVEKDQICCVELTLDGDRQQVFPTLHARLASAA